MPADAAWWAAGFGVVLLIVGVALAAPWAQRRAAAPG